MNTREEIRDILGYEGLYRVSNYGYVMNARTGRILKPGIRMGYLFVIIRKDNKQANRNIHRLVIETFHEDGKNVKSTNHKDGNKLNNHIDNLESCTYSDNTQHALKIKGRRVPPGISKKIKVENAIDGTTFISPSMSSLARTLDVSYVAVWNAINGRSKTVKGLFVSCVD